MVRLPSSPVGIQIGAVMLGLIGLAFAPPASGRMLLVPLDGAAAERLLPLALERGGLLMGAGPFPQSYIVYGDRARLMGSMAHDHILTLAAPPAGCGNLDRIA